MSGSPSLLIDRVREATADEYIIESELGRGGMAAVFLGRDTALDRRVAIKVMLPDLVGVAGSEDRFVVEAKTAAGLDHPGIVTVYAVRQRAGLTFIVMKYIEGQPLDRVLATRGALDSGVVATIGSHVAEALHFAHSRGVIHRDVKPSNIIIDSRGRPIVTDFGIAKVIAAPSLTLAGSIVGSPGYMSPEQCRGLAVTAASDQYSLGVMLYELLTGAPPFSGALFDVLKAQTSEAPPSILATKPEVDPALEAIIMRMLAKKEAERFPSLQEISNALGSLARRRSQAADRQAIMAAIGADVASPPQVVTPPAPLPTPAFEVPPSAPVALNATAALGDAVAGDTVVRPIGDAPVPLAIATGEHTPTGRNQTVIAVVLAATIIAAVVYGMASRSPVSKTAAQPEPATQAASDSVTPTTASTSKPSDSIPAVKAETSLTVRADSTVATKRDSTTTLPPVAASKSSELSRKAVSPKSGPAPRRDPVTQTRPDSTAARCAAINLKLSLGEDMTRADTIFLRRQCSKSRP